MPPMIPVSKLLSIPESISTNQQSPQLVPTTSELNVIEEELQLASDNENLQNSSHREELEERKEAAE